MRFWFSSVLLIPIAATAMPAAEPELGQNAALKYWQAFANMNFDKDDEKLIEDWSKAALDSKTDKLLDNSRIVLLTLHRAAKIEHCDWGLNYEDGPGMLLPHLAKSRSLIRLAALHARREFAQGRPAAAVDDALDMLALARHGNEDFTLISLLVRFASEHIVIELLAPHLKEIDAASLKRLADALDAPRGGFTMSSAMQGEKKYMAGWLIKKFKEAEAQKPGSYRDVIKAVIGPQESKEDAAAIAEMWKAADTYEKTIKMAEDLLPIYDELARLYALPPKEFDAKYPDFMKKVKAENAMAALMLPALDKVVAAQRRNQTLRALLRAAIVIVQSGPDKVGESKDPFGDGPFEYRASDGGFELKSKFKFKDQPVTLKVGQ